MASSSTNTKSLLVTELGENEVPALGETHLESEEYQSPLERLIALSSSEQRGDSLAVSEQWDEINNSNGPIKANDSNATNHRQAQGLFYPIPGSSETPQTKPSRVILAACTCCLLNMGLVWASFLSTSWLDVRLFVDVSFSSIEIKPENSQLLHSMTLGSLLGDLIGANQHWGAIALVLTTLVLPCLSAVSGATWIVEDRKEQIKIMSKLVVNGDRYRSSRHLNHQKNSFGPRMFMEYVARIGCSVFFIFVVLVIGTTPLELEFKDSRFDVVNQMQGGMAAYTLGIVFCLCVLALLRLGRTNFQRTCELTVVSGNNAIVRDAYRLERKPRRKQSYEYSWEVHSNELFTGITSANSNDTGSEGRKLRTPLLENECGDDNPLMDRNALISAVENNHGIQRIDTRLIGGIPAEPAELSLWKRVVLYEMALVSTLLWLPALCLPLFHLKYGGIVSDFMSEISLSFRLKDIPAEFWERGVSAGTDRFILLVLLSIFILLVFVIPITANLAAIGAWIFDTKSSTICRDFLWTIQPCLGTIVFGAALCVSIPAFETVTETAVDKFGTVFCADFEVATADPCFAIQAEPSIGLWFLLGEALALELLVVLTLAWKI